MINSLFLKKAPQRSSLFTVPNTYLLSSASLSMNSVMLGAQQHLAAFQTDGVAYQDDRQDRTHVTGNEHCFEEEASTDAGFDTKHDDYQDTRRCNGNKKLDHSETDASSGLDTKQVDSRKEQEDPQLMELPRTKAPPGDLDSRLSREDDPSTSITPTSSDAAKPGPNVNVVDYPCRSVPPSNEGIATIGENDVLAGRGGGTNVHSGVSLSSIVMSPYDSFCLLCFVFRDLRCLNLHSHLLYLITSKNRDFR
jgi:hypothetical protein